MSDTTYDYDQLRQGIPALSNSAKLERINKGYSSDAKYIVYDPQERPLCLLRTYSIEQDANKRLEFRALERMEEQGVRCSRPIEIGTLPDQRLGYMIVSYIHGEEASEQLPLLSVEDQYAIGVEAGLELRKIHRIQGPADMKPWQERAEAKHRRYRQEYAKCGVRIEHKSAVFSFIDRHLPLMRDRPNRFQHDDFHTGNLIIADGKLSGVIDFNRYDWGDPVHEFLKVGFFSADVSRPFAVGQIHGYYDHSEPDESFWRLYSLYVAMTIVSSVVWILKVKPEELDSMLGKIYKVIDDHDRFELTVPRWYRADWQ
ncbi:aminoglycoside phosphotransferase family protein [Paenibacillus sp. GYB004]|uniref:aminoglycoside phosphotransferase family protein n=1 Tax=Paenibacillus sp. GYB004 TaxID=2994393 RepID=UPI002F96397E